jgi:hypothetical protein
MNNLFHIFASINHIIVLVIVFSAVRLLYSVESAQTIVI